MCAGIVYYQDKIFFTNFTGARDAYEEVKHMLGLEGNIVYDEETTEGKIGEESLQFAYVDEFAQIG